MIVAILVSNNIDISALSTSALFGCGVVSGFLLALVLSAQRWLWWLVGAVLYWLSVDILHQWLSSWLPLTDWECYVLAMGLCWLPFALWISYRILRYGSVSHINVVKDIEVKNIEVEATDVQFKDLQSKKIKPSGVNNDNGIGSNHINNGIEHSPVYDADFKPRFR